MSKWVRGGKHLRERKVRAKALRQEGAQHVGGTVTTVLVLYGLIDN